MIRTWENIPIDVEPGAIHFGKKASLCEGCIFIPLFEVGDEDHSGPVRELFGIHNFELLKICVHAKFEDLLLPNLQILGNGGVTRMGGADNIVDVIESIGAIAGAH